MTVSDKSFPELSIVASRVFSLKNGGSSSSNWDGDMIGISRSGDIEDSAGSLAELGWSVMTVFLGNKCGRRGMADVGRAFDGGEWMTLYGGLMVTVLPDFLCLMLYL